MSTTSGPKGVLGTTYLAGGVIVKNRFVKQGADADHVVQATAASVNVGVATDNQDNTEKVVSVLQKPGETVRIEAGAAFALGAKLASDANGKAVLATTGQPVSAIAREASTAATQLVVCELVNSSVTLAP